MNMRLFRLINNLANKNMVLDGIKDASLLININFT